MYRTILVIAGLAWLSVCAGDILDNELAAGVGVGTKVRTLEDDMLDLHDIMKKANLASSKRQLAEEQIAEKGVEDEAKKQEEAENNVLRTLDADTPEAIDEEKAAEKNVLAAERKQAMDERDELKQVAEMDRHMLSVGKAMHAAMNSEMGVPSFERPEHEDVVDHLQKAEEKRAYWQHAMEQEEKDAKRRTARAVAKEKVAALKVKAAKADVNHKLAANVAALRRKAYEAAEREHMSGNYADQVNKEVSALEKEIKIRDVQAKKVV